MTAWLWPLGFIDLDNYQDKPYSFFEMCNICSLEFAHTFLSEFDYPNVRKGKVLQLT